MIGPVELEYLFGEINAENIDFHDEPPFRRLIDVRQCRPKGGVESISVKSGGLFLEILIEQWLEESHFNTIR